MTFYVLTDSDWLPPDPDQQTNGWRWTYRTDLRLDGPATRVAVSQTAPKENHAAVLGLDEVLAYKWRQHLELSNGVWLMPWFQQLKVVPAENAQNVHDALLGTFKERFGRSPTTYEWEVT